MMVAYHVFTETANFCFYEGEHTEIEITDMNRKIANFIGGLIHGTKSG